MSLAATIRRGSEEDVGAIEYIVRPAYQHYIARIGQPPGPMTNDYHAQVATGNVWVLVFDGEIVVPGGAGARTRLHAARKRSGCAGKAAVGIRATTYRVRRSQVQAVRLQGNGSTPTS
jgi:hypothetical protein